MFKIQTLSLVLLCATVFVPHSLAQSTNTQHNLQDTAAKKSNFNKGNLYNPLQLIQGHVPGLSITRPGGDFNGDFEVRIRGLNTITSENKPLIVIDNMVGVSLSNIDPNDIGEITVLKENAGAALYGMRGANGVILIKTKQAQAGKPLISAHASVSLDRLGKTYEVLNNTDFLALGGPNFGTSTDWIEESTQTAISKTIGFMVSQTLDKTTFSMSANYRDIEGIVSPAFQKRLNARFAVSQKLLSDKLTLSGQMFVTNTERGMVDPLVFREMTVFNPTAPIFDPANTISGGFFQAQIFDSYNPRGVISQQQNQNENKQYLLNFSADYNIMDNLSIAGSYTQENMNTLSGQYWGRNDWVLGANYNGIAGRSTFDQFTEIGDLSVSYQQDWGGIDFDFKAGIAFQNRENEGFVARVRQFLFDAQTFNNLSLGALRSGPFTNVSSFREEDRLNSYYGSINAKFSDRFKAYLNLRADSYSGFIDNKTGVFYGVGLEYDLNENLRLRGSYGKSGNLPPAPGLGESILSGTFPTDLDGDANTTNDIFVAVTPVRSRNPTLQWEETTEFNLGLDFDISSLGLTGTIDYFTRKSKDIIYQTFVSIGGANPFDPGTFHNSSLIYTNAIDLSSGGLEFALAYSKNIGSLHWTSKLNLIRYKQTTIDRLGDFDRIDGGISFSPGGPSNNITRNIVGNAFGDLYAPRLLSVDANGNVEISTQDFAQWEKVGNALPTMDLGFYNAFKFGSWEVSTMLNGSFGHSMLNVTRWFYEPQAVSGSSYNSVVTDKYVGARDFTFSDNYVEKASFLRLNYLSIGRTMNLKNEQILTLELIGQNLFTITSYSGTDPEVRYVHPRNNNSFFQGFSAGVDDRNQYFTTRTYTLAVKMSL